MISKKEVVRFLFEVGSLKQIPRSGWLYFCIKDPESVAEHSFRASIIAFFLTYLETKNLDKAYKAAFLALIHDLHEARVTDLHRLSKKYIKLDERRVIEDQFKGFQEILREFDENYKELEKYVKDADQLELLLQAKEYSKLCSDVMLLTKNLKLNTETAKKLAEEIKNFSGKWLSNLKS